MSFKIGDKVIFFGLPYYPGIIVKELPEDYYTIKWQPYNELQRDVPGFMLQPLVCPNDLLKDIL